LRHHHGGPEEKSTGELHVGPLELDLVHHEARLDARALELTAKEFELLAFLARHANKVCTRQMILGAVWGSGYANEAQYLHAYVHRLRQKLGAGSTISIRTAPGIGYLLGESGEASTAEATP
jgi:two-component system KDP operon response regulator KdpE